MKLRKLGHFKKPQFLVTIMFCFSNNKTSVVEATGGKNFLWTAIHSLWPSAYRISHIKNKGEEGNGILIWEAIIIGQIFTVACILMNKYLQWSFKE